MSTAKNLDGDTIVPNIFFAPTTAEYVYGLYFDELRLICIYLDEIKVSGFGPFWPMLTIGVIIHEAGHWLADRTFLFHRAIDHCDVLTRLAKFLRRRNEGERWYLTMRQSLEMLGNYDTTKT